MLFHSLSPFHGINAGRSSAAMDEDFPRKRFLPAFLRALLSVYGNHDALAAEFFCRLFDKKLVLHCGRVDGHFIRAGIEQAAYIVKGPDAAADRERHEDLARRPLHHVKDDIAALMGCGDIKKHQLIGQFLVIELGVFNRVSGILQVYEIDALYHPAVFNVKAWYDSFCQHD
jgi:hypothetical protein